MNKKDKHSGFDPESKGDVVRRIGESDTERLLEHKPGRDRHWNSDGILVEVLPSEDVEEIRDAFSREVDVQHPTVKALAKLLLSISSSEE